MFLENSTSSAKNKVTLPLKKKKKIKLYSVLVNACTTQGRTDHLETRALPEGPGSVGGPMRCPWYLFHRLF
ncbi:unnamed protein product [Staurois parvus]|uniref:Uncharacterized protein n=1 Tax=Staurois parvus TaxID=386267 RepID=A0ABN9D504_9NEOB|nr:unnamed protein product [Staurois parvus]